MVFCLVIAASVWGITLVCDRERLNNELIRLHVVAASDAASDQQIKLNVRDAVLKSISEEMANITDVEEAKRYFNENLAKIETVANRVLLENGSQDTATVSLGKEKFDMRRYDTFTLPAGVYETLRITIGEGNGKNWWCVAFPALCVGATAQEFEAVAAGAGFPEILTAALEGRDGYQLRFYFLELLGRMQNKLLQE